MLLVFGKIFDKSSKVFASSILIKVSFSTILPFDSKIAPFPQKLIVLFRIESVVTLTVDEYIIFSLFCEIMFNDEIIIYQTLSGLISVEAFNFNRRC